jgi:hypothetical protein
MTADIQVAVYHLYRLADHYKVATSQEKMKQIYEEWLEWYCDLIQEISKKEMLEPLQKEELGDDAREVLKEVIGSSIQLMFR